MHTLWTRLETLSESGTRVDAVNSTPSTRRGLKSDVDEYTGADCVVQRVGTDKVCRRRTVRGQSTLNALGIVKLTPDSAGFGAEGLVF